MSQTESLMLKTLSADDKAALLKWRESIVSLLKEEGFSLEVSNHVQKLRRILTDSDDYEYDYDFFFDEAEVSEENSIMHFLYDGPKVISTYSARVIDWDQWRIKLQIWLMETNGNWYFKQPLDGITVYSSCQWVDSTYRGKKLGVYLDIVKKIDSLLKFNWDYQFSHCRAQLETYHRDVLKYAHVVAAFTSSAVPGSGTSEDKYYFINWIEPDELVALARAAVSR